ncbi:glutamate--tRNA ligase [Candidatus Woesearchaeota archaeon]|nr:glutamate--tRNA ligase [Candidatus Woesearchaeota archaeon]
MIDRNLIERHALANALKFGAPSKGAVIGKVLAEDPLLKGHMRELARLADEVISEVVKLSPRKRKDRLLALDPDALGRKAEGKAHDLFAFLRIPDGEKVVTAFPPEPSKYPHIGHAKAALLNYELAKRHSGTFILRFEDTNPQLAKQEFYDIILENLAWLGIEPDKVVHASDFMIRFYDCAKKLIEQGDAYVCSCSQEAVRRSRMTGKACACRKASVAENLDAWRRMQNQDEGLAVLRARIDLMHQNTAMRDPTIFRIIDDPHPRAGTKYRVWPNYDFESAVMDGLQVTHRIRSKEFELRNELQRHIQKRLGLKETRIFEVARFTLSGVETSGRMIRERIQSGELMGWDDPSLATLVALRRRGFLPKAIREFVLATGITKSESTLTWDDLIVHNKRLLDAIADRCFFVWDPVRVGIDGAPEQEVRIKRHPDDPKKGERVFLCHTGFFLTKHDYDGLVSGRIYRLMECLNFRKEGERLVFDSLDVATYKAKGERIMHFLPDDGSAVPVRVLMPDRTTVQGIAEPGVANLSVGDQVQFERFGFVRLDSHMALEDGRQVPVFIFSHR